MAIIDPAAGKVENSHGATGSWQKPYPTALPCAEIVLHANGPDEVTGGTLDLAKAVATVKTGAESAEFPASLPRTTFC